MAEPSLSLEEAFQRLEEIVQTLEQGGLPMKDMLALYEEGMSLARCCQQHLKEAELKITQLQALWQEEGPANL